MLKSRVIPSLLFNGTSLVKGQGFSSWRRVGTPMQAVRVMNMRDVDELVFLDIAATPEGRSPDFQQIDELADNCFMPLTVGGGVKSVDDVRSLLAVGADKVAINSAALENPEIVRAASVEFGAQCIVVSIDVAEIGGRHTVVGRCGTVDSGRDPLEWARHCSALGAGEILLTHVGRDGTLSGLDIGLIGRVAAAVPVPLIGAGGACSANDFIDAVKAGASGVAAGALFQFTEQTPAQMRDAMRLAGLSVRGG
ncbi:imidazole glycerol phosphate synthase subunit HisF [Alsobacter sp. R-9]